MNDAEKRENVIRGLEAHANPKTCETCAGEYCPYYDRDGSYTAVTCSSFLAADALALLKEQEARVMTVEEIRTGEIETLWIEVKEKPHIFPGIWYRRSKKDGIPAIDITLNTGIVRGTVVSYGYAWRCWTSHPTEEQRKAVKWNG